PPAACSVRVAFVVRLMASCTPHRLHVTKFVVGETSRRAPQRLQGKVSTDMVLTPFEDRKRGHCGLSSQTIHNVPVTPRHFFERRRIPDSHRFVSRGAGQASAVGTESHTHYSFRVPLERKRFLASSRVPDLHCPVPRGTGQASAVRAEGHPVDNAGMSLEKEH